MKLMRWGELVQRKYSRLSLRAASTASEPGKGGEWAFYSELGVVWWRRRERGGLPEHMR